MGDLRLQTAIPILDTNKAIITTAQFTLMEEVNPMTAKNLSRKARKLYQRAKDQGFFNVDGWGLYEPSQKEDKGKAIKTLRKLIKTNYKPSIKEAMKKAEKEWSKVNNNMPVFYIS